MESRETPDFSKGVMDEKILWYLGRLGDVQVSPDGQTLLYTVTYYDYRVNKGNTELYTMPATGGEPTRITVTEENEMQPARKSPSSVPTTMACRSGRPIPTARTPRLSAI